MIPLQVIHLPHSSANCVLQQVSSELFRRLEIGTHSEVPQLFADL